MQFRVKAHCEFQFPSNGKAHSDIIRSVPTGCIITMFQFPSNGKAHSDRRDSVRSRLPRGFQFPSNGKAHSDRLSGGGSPRTDGTFQFPSNGKAHSDPARMFARLVPPGFQFPSNGKAHSDFIVQFLPFWGFGFNSLQTGRHIQTHGTFHTLGDYQVSIPFKREGTFRPEIASRAFFNLAEVSIPFKREGTFRQTPISAHTGRGSGHPKPNTNCARLFFRENLPQKSRKPTWPLNQTRFFRKNGSKPRHHVRSWTF